MVKVAALMFAVHDNDDVENFFFFVFFILNSLFLSVLLEFFSSLVKIF